MGFQILQGLRLLGLSVAGASQRTRYEARHALLSGIANRLGYRLYNKNLYWLEDEEFRSVWRGFPEYEPGPIHERRFNLYYIAKGLTKIPGDTVECGVWRGGSSYLIMRATAQPGRVHHVFDSFQGLSEPDNRDKVTDPRTYSWAAHDLSAEEALVRRNLSGVGNLRTYAGWIPQRFEEVGDRQFSLVHIDVDLYQPTWDCLDFFYNRLSSGGAIVCDDYGSKACPGARDAVDTFVADRGETVIHLTTGQGLLVKR